MYENGEIHANITQHLVGLKPQSKLTLKISYTFINRCILNMSLGMNWGKSIVQLKGGRLEGARLFLIEIMVTFNYKCEVFIGHPHTVTI